jgi:hypothetical protein
MLPEPLGFSQGINLGVLPPDLLIAGAVERFVVSVAERHDPSVAGFGAHRPGLGKTYVMRLARRSAAHNAWQGRHEAKVLLIANAPRFGYLCD